MSRIGFNFNSIYSLYIFEYFIYFFELYYEHFRKRLRSQEIMMFTRKKKRYTEHWKIGILVYEFLKVRNSTPFLLHTTTYFFTEHCCDILEFNSILTWVAAAIAAAIVSTSALSIHSCVVHMHIHHLPEGKQRFQLLEKVSHFRTFTEQQVYRESRVKNIVICVLISIKYATIVMHFTHVKC